MNTNSEMNEHYPAIERALSILRCKFHIDHQFDSYDVAPFKQSELLRIAEKNVDKKIKQTCNPKPHKILSQKSLVLNKYLILFLEWRLKCLYFHKLVKYTRIKRLKKLRNLHIINCYNLSFSRFMIKSLQIKCVQRLGKNYLSMLFRKWWMKKIYYRNWLKFLQK